MRSLSDAFELDGVVSVLLLAHPALPHWTRMPSLQPSSSNLRFGAKPSAELLREATPRSPSSRPPRAGNGRGGAMG